jgi:hypothetical protein
VFHRRALFAFQAFAAPARFAVDVIPKIAVSSFSAPQSGQH